MEELGSSVPEKSCTQLYTACFHLAPFFRAEFWSRNTLFDPLIVGRSHTLSKKGQYCATWTIPKRGGAARSAQNCHTVQRLITWGFLLLPLDGLKLQLFFFLAEVSGSFVYLATGIFWEVSPSKISTTFVWTRPPMHFRHQWVASDSQKSRIYATLAISCKQRVFP